MEAYRSEIEAAVLRESTSRFHLISDGEIAVLRSNEGRLFLYNRTCEKAVEVTGDYLGGCGFMLHAL